MIRELLLIVVAIIQNSTVVLTKYLITLLGDDVIYYRKEAICLVLSVVTAIGCSQGAKRILPPSIDASSAGAEAIVLYDTDHDGKISGNELDKCPALRSAMGPMDKNSDQAITADEIAARIQAWKDARIGRLSVRCTVMRNGRPLPAADVRFVPEKILGENVKPARGKTNTSGMAIMGGEESEGRGSRGVSPGLYRVEITMAGENIPEKYNTESTLGLEIASDVAGIREGFKFNLAY